MSAGGTLVTAYGVWNVLDVRLDRGAIVVEVTGTADRDIPRHLDDVRGRLHGADGREVTVGGFKMTLDQDARRGDVLHVWVAMTVKGRSGLVPAT